MSIVAVAVASLLAGLAAWVIFARTSRTLRFDLHKVPGPKQLPLLGNIGSIIGSSYFHRILAQWTDRYGPIFKWSLAGTNVLVITDPEEVNKFCSREMNLPKANAFYTGINPRAPHNNMLATPDYDEWKYMRKMTNTAFSPDNIRKAYPKIYQSSLKAVEVLQIMSQQGLVDVSNMSARITAEVINAVAFEVDMGALGYKLAPDNAVQLAEQPFLQHSKVYQDHLTLAFTNPAYALLLFLFPWHPKAKRAKLSVTEIKKKEDELADMVLDRGQQPDSNTALWACLSRFRSYKTGGPLPRDTLAANAGIFFAAGYETTAHAITWALFELAANPELQARVQQELRAAGLAPTPADPNPRPLEFADLSKLKMVDAVLKETLRLHSTAPIGTVREADQDMVIKGYRIPKGTPLMLAPHPMHVSPFNFLHPNRFWPERWVTDTVPEANAKMTAYPDATPAGNRRNINGSWNPFSTGPRNCIGQALALAEARTVLAVLLSNFTFELPEGVQREKFIEEEEVWWVTLQAKHGLPLKITPITAWM